MRNRQIDRVFQDYNQAIQLNPNYAEAYCNRGSAFVFFHKTEWGIKDLNRAIQLNPNYVRAYDTRGNVYYRLGRYELALQDYNRVIQLNPNYEGAAFVHLGIERCLKAMGR